MLVISAAWAMRLGGNTRIFGVTGRASLIQPVVYVTVTGRLGANGADTAAAMPDKNRSRFISKNARDS